MKPYDITYRLLAVVILSLAAVAMRAQTDAQFTQYWAVPAYYNAGAVGNIDFIHITAGSRLQWLGIKHAPMTFGAMADMPFKFLGRRWGTGIVLQAESMGLYRNVTAEAQLAWKKNMLHGTLSVGLQAGIINETFKGSPPHVVTIDGDDAHSSADDAIPQSDVGGTAFDSSVGVMFTHKRFWVGASVTHLTAPTVTLKMGDDEQHQYEFDVGRNYYFMAGGNIPLQNTLFELLPSVMVKTDLKAFQAEATARFRYNRFLSAGVAYRYKDAISAMIGVDYKNFFVGYSYDYATSALNRASYGSHELFLQYNVKLNMGERNRNKHKAIRIM